MFKKNKKYFLGFSQLGLGVSIYLMQFVESSQIVSLLVGLFTGLSIVFSIAALLDENERRNNQHL